MNINGIELIIKTINDKQLNFKLPKSDRIKYIHYYININDDKITGLWFTASNFEQTDINHKSLDDTIYAFMSKI